MCRMELMFVYNVCMYQICYYNSHTAKSGTEIYHNIKVTWLLETLKTLSFFKMLYPEVNVTNLFNTGLD